MNKRRFLETNQNVFKSKINGQKAKGAKFVNQEISFSLTPQGEDFEKAMIESMLDEQEDESI